MINIYGKGGHGMMIGSLTDESYSLYNDDDWKRAGDHPWIVGIGDNKNRKKVAKGKKTRVLPSFRTSTRDRSNIRS